jgi:TolB-like protein/Tfp pilus assembly protein PilF
MVARLASGTVLDRSGGSMTESPKGVFLSYASQDAGAARPIAEALRAAGVEVWFDQSELRGGDAWDQKIKKQIRECSLFIALVSAQTNARPEGYFRREWKLAVDRTHDMADDAPFLLPVTIDDTPNATARVPDKFREVQWTVLPGGATPPDFVARVRRLLEPDAQVTPARMAVGASGVGGAAGGPLPRVELKFLQKLRHRNVGRVAILYLGISWLVLEPIHVIFNMLGVPEWINRLVVVFMALGFPVAVLTAWVYEVTPEGLKPSSTVDPRRSLLRRTGTRLNRAILSVLSLMVVYFLVYHFWLARHLIEPVAEGAREGAQDKAEAAIEVTQRSIAVLPFVDMSQSKDQEYLSDGLAEELLDLLAKIPELRVAARTSAFAFRDKAEDVPTIAKKLHVAHILEGSVRKAGSRVRITAQLIRADSGYHLWSETYDRDLTDIFKLQDEIAGAVVQALKVALLGGALPARAAPKSPEAYNLYLQGRFLADLHTKESLAKAIDYFQRAIKLDPTYEPTWTALSFAYSDTGARGFVSSDQALAQARAAASEALKLDPKSARAHVALGLIHMNIDWDWAAADREFKQALAYDPGNATVLSLGGYLELAFGHTTRAATLFQQALARDPLHASAYNNLGIAYCAEGHLPQAEAAFRKSIELKPAQSYTHSGLGLVLLSQGKREAALAEMGRESDEGWRLEGLAIANHALGKHAEADAALAELTRKFDKDAPYSIATVHAYRGEKDQAFQWLDRAVAERDGTLAGIKVDPLLKPLMGDPRYQALLKKLGLPE